MTVSKDSRKSYVYVLFDIKHPDVIRYVGKTVNPKARLNNHIYVAKTNKKKTHKDAWICSVLSNGSDVGMKIVKIFATQTEAYEEEKRYITDLKSREFNLTNLSDGGKGNFGFSYLRTPETRKKLSKATTLHMSTLSDDEKQIRAAKRLKTIYDKNDGVYPGYTKGIPSHFKGKKWTPEMKAKAAESHKARWAKIKENPALYAATCQNISDATKKAMQDPDIKTKLSESGKGRIPWNKKATI